VSKSKAAPLSCTTSGLSSPAAQIATMHSWISILPNLPQFGTSPGCMHAYLNVFLALHCYRYLVQRQTNHSPSVSVFRSTVSRIELKLDTFLEP
jgi:hypothetical protein